MRSQRSALASVLVAVALAGTACSSDDDTAAPATTATTTTTTSPPTTTVATTAPQPVAPTLTDEYLAFRQAPTACGADAPDPVTPMSFDAPQDQGLDPATPIRIIMETSCGDLEIELDPAVSPIAVNSFVFLARSGYFDGSVSHRIVSGFMFQAGDPTARGTGRPGYVLAEDEYPDAGFIYERGVVAMANAGPGTTGSQFFIMMGSRELPTTFTPIGRLVGGFEVLDAIAAIPVGPNVRGELSFPLETLYLESVRVEG